MEIYSSTIIQYFVAAASNVFPYLIHNTKWLIVGLVLILILTKLLITSTSSWLWVLQFTQRDINSSWPGRVNYNTKE